MKIAFQMDPIGDVNINADSSFRLAEEAQARGHSLFFYTPDHLAYQEGRITARGQDMTVQRVPGTPAILGEMREVDLAEFDVVWLRQDPEKLMVLDFPDLTPPTTIARDLSTIKAFKEKHGDVILKPLYGNGGAGVFKLTTDDRNLSSLHELFTGFSREPLIVQKFLPAVSKGDKRVILVDGEPVGAINRVPAEGETRSNMHVGGRPEKVGLTDRDREICARIGGVLKEKGQVFVGIDVIGDYLTEINVTSPTGIQELERFDGVNIAAKIWEVIEAKRA